MAQIPTEPPAAFITTLMKYVCKDIQQEKTTEKPNRKTQGEAGNQNQLSEKD